MIEKVLLQLRYTVIQLSFSLSESMVGEAGGGEAGGGKLVGGSWWLPPPPHPPLPFRQYGMPKQVDLLYLGLLIYFILFF